MPKQLDALAKLIDKKGSRSLEPPGSNEDYGGYMLAFAHHVMPRGVSVFTGTVQDDLQQQLLRSIVPKTRTLLRCMFGALIPE